MTAVLSLVAGLFVAAGVTDRAAASPPVTVSAQSDYFGRTVSVAPTRLLDTRFGTGAPVARVPALGTLPLQILGRGPIPSGGVSAVFLSLVELNATSAGYVTAWPDNYARNKTSILNFASPAAVTNFLPISVPEDGRVDFYNGSATPIDLIADVTAYVIGPAGPVDNLSGSSIQDGVAMQVPNRTYDSRVNGAPLQPGTSYTYNFQGPTAGRDLSAVLATITVTNVTKPGFLSLAPGNDTSVLDFAAGETLANTVIAHLASGSLQIYNGSPAPVDIIVDTLGSVMAGDTGVPSLPRSVTLTRALDTRTSATEPSSVSTTAVRMPSSVPRSAQSVLVNITVTQPSAPGYLTAWASGVSQPVASMSNFSANQTVARFAVVPLGADGRIDIFLGSPGAAQLIVDVMGYVAGGGTPLATPAPPTVTASTDNTLTVQYPPTPTGASRLALIRRGGGRVPLGLMDGYEVLNFEKTSEVTDSSLQPGTVYTYVIVALGDDGGFSLPSAPATATTTGARSPFATGVLGYSTTVDPEYALGQPQLLDAANASIAGQGTLREISFSGGGGGVSSSGLSFDAKPPAGQSFHVGFYPRVTTSQSPVPGHASVDYYIGGSDRDSVGDIEIRDLHTDSSGQVDRLDLLFHVHPNADEPEEVRGEFRVGEDDLTNGALSMNALSWPRTPAGSSTTALLGVHNPTSAPLPVGRLRAVGSEFSLSGDSCSGRTLQPGWYCSVTVTNRATVSGPHTGTVTVPIGNTVHVVQLDSNVAAGITDFRVFASVAPDASVPMSVGGNGNRIVFGSNGFGEAGLDEVAAFSAPNGSTLSVGSYSAQSYGSSTTPGLLFVHNGSGCSVEHGSFTVKQLVLNAEGLPLHADVTFSQFCDQGTSSTDGEVRWNTEADVTPPPVVTGLKVAGAGSSRTITWTKPVVSDFASTTVRLIAGPPDAAALPVSGYPVYAGSGTQATAVGLVAGRTYTVAVFSVERSGNVSAPTFSGLIAG